MKAGKAKAEVTRFQRRVYEAVSLIPPGRVATYAQVARWIGCGSPRAVGQALRVNPFAPRVPCHRVIAGGLRLGGFKGRTQGAALREKAALLAAEGVAIRDGRVVDERCLFEFEGA